MRVRGVLQCVVVTTVNTITSVLTGRDVTIFGSNLHPIVPRCLRGHVSHGTLTTADFTVNFNLIVNCNLPASVTTDVVLVRYVLLAASVVNA